MRNSTWYSEDFMSVTQELFKDRWDRFDRTNGTFMLLLLLLSPCRLSRQIGFNFTCKTRNVWNDEEQGKMRRRERCEWRASSAAEPPLLFTHTCHSNDRGGEFHSLWPLPAATGPLCTHYKADLVNWTNHLWLSTDSGLVIQQRQRSFFIMWYDIAAWIVEAVFHCCAWCIHTAHGVRRGAESVIAHHSFGRIGIRPDCVMGMLTGKLSSYYGVRALRLCEEPTQHSCVVRVCHHLAQWTYSTRNTFKTLMS